MRKRKRTAVPRVQYPLSIPAPLNDRLEAFLEVTGGRGVKGKSKNQVIVEALERDLARRYEELPVELRSRMDALNDDGTRSDVGET